FLQELEAPTKQAMDTSRKASFGLRPAREVRQVSDVDAQPTGIETSTIFRRASSFLPPAREVQQWADADAKSTGIEKAEIIRWYLLLWTNDKATLLSEPLDNVLDLLLGEVQEADLETAARIALSLLRNYGASTKVRTHIAARISKKRP